MIRRTTVRRSIVTACASVLAAALGTGIAPALAQTAPSSGAPACKAVRTVALPQGSDSPFGIGFGPGGVYVAVGNTIDKVSHGDVVTRYRIGTPKNSDAGWIAWDGHAKHIWFTDRDGRIGTLTPAGKKHEWRVPGGTKQPLPQSIVFGKHHSIWFTDESNNRIGRLSPKSGKFSFWTVPTGDPLGLTRGHDGDLYFIERAYDRVGRLDPHTGLFTEWTLPKGAFPNRIVTAPHGDVWFTSLLDPRIWRIGTNGHLTQWKVAGGPVGVAFASGRLYTALFDGNGVAQIDLKGKVTRRWKLPTKSAPLQVAARGGQVWASGDADVYHIDTTC